MDEELKMRILTRFDLNREINILLFLFLSKTLHIDIYVSI